MSERRTITTSTNPGDSTAAAQKVADNLRAQGYRVTVGEEYDNVTVRHYGMRSVDLDIEDPLPPSPPEPEPQGPVEVPTAPEAVTETVAEAETVVVETPSETETTAGVPDTASED